METEPDGMGTGQRNMPGACGAIPNRTDRLSNCCARALEWFRRDAHWLDLLILLLAAALRLVLLDLKPAHFDEGVNGYFVDEMTRRGFYHYDPTNFHGPLHFYVLFIAQTLLGRQTWALRLPLALASIGCVAFMLFGFRRFVSPFASRIAAVAMAISPAFTFYGRYAIHETWLVLFLMMLVAGIAGMWRDGRLRDLWMAGLGFAGTILTKETWILHLVAIGLGGVALAILERLSPSAPFPRGATRFGTDDLARVATICAGLIIFFYSGCLVDPSGLVGFAQMYMKWVQTGTSGESGHEKEWWYWLQLGGIYEWPVLLGVLAACFVVMPRTTRFIRWTAITGLGTLVAYSIIKYKTPWCLISWAWPFCLTLGVAVEWVARNVDRWVAGAAVALVCGQSLAKSGQLNFVKYTDETEPYVYVQTTNDIRNLLDPLEWQVKRNPTTRYRLGHVIQEEHHPLIWLLGDRPNITWGDHTAAPSPMDAEWLLVDSSARDRVEEGLTEPYFRTRVHLRGMAPDESFLYLRAESFRACFPGRAAEFQPSHRPAAPAPPLP